MRRLAFTVSIVLTLVVGAAWTGVFAQGDPIKIGVIQPLSGPVAASGNYIRMGAEIGRDWVNARGGVLGRKVELLIEDNKSDPKEAATAAEKLIVRDKVPAIMGTVEECVEQLGPHLEAGVDRIIFVPYKYEKEQVEAVAREIIPRLKNKAK